MRDDLIRMAGDLETAVGRASSTAETLRDYIEDEECAPTRVWIEVGSIFDDLEDIVARARSVREACEAVEHEEVGDA